MKRFLILASLVFAVVGCNLAPESLEKKPVTSPNSSSLAVNPMIKEPTIPEGFNKDRVNQFADLKKVDVALKGKKFSLMLMDNESKRAEGMMFVENSDLRDDQGMLFVFPETQPDDGKHGFWMKNCFIDLDIIYVNPKGKVVNISKGVAGDLTQIPPGGDYQYVIELKFGNAAKVGLKKGDVIDLPKDLKSE